MVCFSYKVWRDGNRHRQLCAIYADLQYCSVKDFQLGIGFGEKVKGEGLKVFSCPFSPSPFTLNRQVLRRLVLVYLSDTNLNSFCGTSIYSRGQGSAHWCQLNVKPAL
ncbi:hypothetical protein FDUTEX481_08148 [Tolypothrix sp. PCC 7601]|nr:hypothetical protein FDUTEX481_08148 [Tolypothrix sp. PCC 7601]